MPIRNNLLVLMAKQNIRSYSEMSRKSNLNYGVVRKFAREEGVRFDSDTVEKLCSTLNCDIKDLLYIEKKA